MKRTFRLIHRWLGYPLGILFLVTLLTGIVIGIEDYIQNQRNYGQTYIELSAAEVAGNIAQLHQAHPGYRQIQVPTPASPVFIVSMRGEKIVYAAQTLEPLATIGGSQTAVFSYILRLHRSLALGRNGPLGLSGAEWVAWIGLLSAAIAFLGLYLWWPLRKSFQLKKLLPTNNKPSSYFLSHLTGGVVCLLFLLLFAITGAAIAYRPVAQAWLLDDEPADSRPVVLYTGKPWHFAVEYLYETEPQAVLKSVAQTRSGRTTPDWQRDSMELRYTSEHDWLGLAGSSVFVATDSGAILGQQAFADLPLGHKLYRMIVPLHTGRGVTSNYLLAMLLIMSLLLVVIVAGLISFLRRKTKLDKSLNRVPTLKGWIA